MFTRRIEILIVGLAFAGKNCGATEVAVLPGDPQLAIAPQTRIKKSDVVKMPTQKKEKPAIKKGKNPNKRRRNQNDLSGPQRTINGIIHDVMGENGVVYSRPSEEIFDGSGREALNRELKKNMREIINQIKSEENIEDLGEWLEVIDQHISNLEQTISMAYFELSDYTPDQIEHHNRYYGLAKSWFERLKKEIIEKMVKEE